MKYSSALSGRILDMLPPLENIIDCHVHLGSYGKHHIPHANDTAAIISMMDMTGIKQACVSHLLSLVDDLYEGNDLSCITAAVHPGRFNVYLVFDPNYPLEYNMAGIEKYSGNRYVKGIKIHSTLHNASPDDHRYYPVYEICNSRKMIVLAHTWGLQDVKGVEKAAKKYKDAAFIIGHSGGYDLNANHEAIRLAGSYDNIYLDLAISGLFEGIVELMVQKASSDKVLFGSDMPFMDPRGSLGRICFAEISDTDKEKILYMNFEGLLRRTI